ncbi:hypothetical protein PCANC_26485 [Puccinia coronata f. sp. avenae]|uniref:Uncharacterized protein n=1 Tax=Puccinia coronata f. sp. avenae TaxID=200324 RepID=A0A2N5TLA0_9BASI|nr:hypothetical protein PCANC_26485 [Puccinia coronata f. sp. avenae]
MAQDATPLIHSDSRVIPPLPLKSAPSFIGSVARALGSDTHPAHYVPSAPHLTETYPIKNINKRRKPQPLECSCTWTGPPSNTDLLCNDHLPQQMSAPTLTGTLVESPHKTKRKSEDPHDSLADSSSDDQDTNDDRKTVIADNPFKKVLRNLPTEEDSNMTVAAPYDPDEHDVKPDISALVPHPSNWEELRACVLRRSTPHIRFRATWDGIKATPRGNLEEQKVRNVLVIMVRALGDGRTLVDRPDISLESAFASLKIRPALVQRAKEHLDWPNEYFVHLSPNDAMLLPSFDEHRKTLARYLRFKVHLPACGPINPADTPADIKRKYPLMIDQGAVVTPRWTKAEYNLVKHNGEKFNGHLTFNGDLTYYLTEIPRGEVPTRLWRGGAVGHLLGKICDWPVRLELLSTCSVCGSEDHKGQRCVYKDILAGRPVSIEIPTNEIMEISP